MAGESKNDGSNHHRFLPRFDLIDDPKTAGLPGARHLPLSDPEPELDRFIDELLLKAEILMAPEHLTIAEHLVLAQHPELAAPKEPINAQNAGKVIIEAAADELRAARADLFLARRHEDYLRAAYRLVLNIRRITPYTDMIPGTVYEAIARERMQQQGREAGKAKQVKNRQRPPTARQRVFDEVVARLLEKGTEVTGANLKKVLDRMTGEGVPMPQSVIDRRLQKYRQREFDAVVDPLLQKGVKVVSTQDLIPALGKKMPQYVIERLVRGL